MYSVLYIRCNMSIRLWGSYMIQRERLAKDFDAMAQLTAPGEGINRLAFTDSDWEGRPIYH